MRMSIKKDVNLLFFFRPLKIKAKLCLVPQRLFPQVFTQPKPNTQAFPPRTTRFSAQIHDQALARGWGIRGRVEEREGAGTNSFPGPSTLFSN